VNLIKIMDRKKKKSLTAKSDENKIGDTFVKFLLFSPPLWAAAPGREKKDHNALT
jgi:hypothetical protein